MILKDLLETDWFFLPTGAENMKIEPKAICGACVASSTPQDLISLGKAEKLYNALAVESEQQIPKAAKLLYRTCRTPGPDSLPEAVQHACGRNPALLPMFSEDEDWSFSVIRGVDPVKHTLSTAFLSPQYSYASSLPDGGKGGALVRCFITDGSGNGLHELAIYWSKEDAQAVRRAIPDCEQL